MGVIEMRLYGHKGRRVLSLTTLALVFYVLSGCAMVGPRSISLGRADYNEAIERTDSEQMLLSIVKGRYGETASLLAVSGIAANFRFAASAGTEIWWGIGITTRSPYDLYFHGQFKYLGWRLNNEKRMVEISKCC